MRRMRSATGQILPRSMRGGASRIAANAQGGSSGNS